MHVDEAIRRRRSHKLFDGTGIDRQILVDLIELATWAPNHHYTEPWRFNVVVHERVGALLDAMVRTLPSPGGARPDDKIAAKLDKLRQTLAGAGAVIGVSYVHSPGDPIQDREDYAATCCAIQNLLLGATGRGLVSYWATSGAFIGPRMRGFWGVADDETLVGAVALGRPVVAMPAVRYHAPGDVTRWL